MTTQTEALKLALEALDQLTNAADTFSVSGVYFNEEVWARKCLSDAYFALTTIEETLSTKCVAQPEQEQNLKLMPREATPEMLKAMDECSTEGYDERLYEGHAGSVYMAAWDAFHGQHCYCGDITNLGVIHREDGPCHYPEHKEPKQEPVFWLYQNKSTHEVRFQKNMRDFVDHSLWSEIPLYGEPLANHELQCVCGAVWMGDELVHLPYKRPPQRKPLTDEQIEKLLDKVIADKKTKDQIGDFARAIEAAHGIKGNT